MIFYFYNFIEQFMYFNCFRLFWSILAKNITVRCCYSNLENFIFSQIHTILTSICLLSQLSIALITAFTPRAVIVALLLASASRAFRVSGASRPHYKQHLPLWSCPQSPLAIVSCGCPFSHWASISRPKRRNWQQKGSDILRWTVMGITKLCYPRAARVSFLAHACSNRL